MTQSHAGLMDNVYRSQRHIYDVTRKFYLLGRDQLIAELAPKAGDTVLEVGCGTGRNLLQAARKYPLAQFYGFDISSEMLATARKNVEKSKKLDSIFLDQGDASDFSDARPFAISTFDTIFYSYTLSMIPSWKHAIEQGVRSLKAGGDLLIVDFGQQENLPIFFKALLSKWLAIFHVEPRADLIHHCEALCEQYKLSMEFRSLYRGYTWSIRLTKPIQ